MKKQMRRPKNRVRRLKNWILTRFGAGRARFHKAVGLKKAVMSSDMTARAMVMKKYKLSEGDILVERTAERVVSSF